MFVKKTIADLSLILLVLSGLTGVCDAAIPLQINHQGFIDVGGTAFNGNGDFRFALVDPDSGNNVWTNDASAIGTSGTPTNPVDLPVINGIYNVRLGDTTLANMTRAALRLLETDLKGFWLLIEAGDVDWANHGNNIDNSIGAVLSGEAAFQAVTDWAEKNDRWKDTVIIVTADHGHYFQLRKPAALLKKGDKSN